MAVGNSDDPVAADAIAAAIAQCRVALGGHRPQAGILFCAVDLFEPSMAGAVREAFPDVELVGATSSAEMSSEGGYGEDSLVLTLFASDDIDITVGLGRSLREGADEACRAAVEKALRGTQREPRVCVAIGEAVALDSQLTLEAVSRALPEGVAVVGGFSARSDFSRLAPSYQFHNDEVVAEGIILLLFSGAVKFSAAVGTGWTTVGPRGTVTRADYGLLHEIDGGPAADFIARYVGLPGRPRMAIRWLYSKRAAMSSTCARCVHPTPLSRAAYPSAARSRSAPRCS